MIKIKENNNKIKIPGFNLYIDEELYNKHREFVMKKEVAMFPDLANVVSLFV